jgi:hypothetical protein
MKKVNFANKLAPFGIRHEVAKRYTPLDWWKANKVSKKIQIDAADREISELIRKNSPGLVGRLGGTEARFLGEYEKLRRWKNFGIPIEISSKFSLQWKKRRKEVFTNAGFYSDSWSEIENFARIYAEALAETDVLGAWGVAFTWVEGKYINYESTKLIPVGHTAPWIAPYSESSKINRSLPWANQLSGKRVLVISAFAESITKQHSKISQVFPSIEFPEFELTTIRSPITSGQRDKSGKSWFELLEEMKHQIRLNDFDIALIAAGAFSYPLAAYVKEVGKIGIHCGGGLQLFFGLMGNRWSNSPEIQRYVNGDWTRPSDDERPASASEIENACYW